MKSSRYVGFAVAALAGASCFLGIGASQAKAGRPANDHDGIYALHIVTEHGSCPNTYKTKLAVSGNQIYATDVHCDGRRIVSPATLRRRSMHGCDRP